MNTTTKQLLVAVALAALTACGSSSSSAPSTGTPGTSNLFLQGPITALTAGQIQVAGVTVTTPPTVHLEGVEHPESELRKGMVVKVKAHGSGRHAEGIEVEFEDAVKGSVESTGSDTLQVGGQTVHVDDATEFEDQSGRLGSIAPGQRVRVSGVPDDRGGIRATRIDRTSDAAHELELKGWVSDLSATGFTLKLSPDSGPSATYAVTLAAGVTLPTGLASGAFVEVHSAAPIQAGNAIVASDVVLEDGQNGDQGEESEVEGIVTSGTSDQFMVSGRTVTTSASTRWDGGLPADLAMGAEVEAEGVIGAGGVLAAQVVSFRGNARLIGVVTARAGAGGDTTFEVNGVPVKGDGATDWRTGGAAIADGDWVEVRGRADRTGAGLVATRIEAKSSGNGRPVVQGLVTAVDASAGTVTLLGVTIGADGSTEFQGHEDTSGVDGAGMTRDAFFAGLTAGISVAKATGQGHADWSAGPTGAARSLELQGEE